MEIYLVRHTTPEVPKGICYGQSDLPVADTFQTEKDQVISKLAKDFDRVYSSPLKRCSILANEITHEVKIEPCLMEMNFGSWEMKAWNKISNLELDPWMSDFVNTTVPQGESFSDLISRVNAFLESVKTEKHERICIVSHAGVIRTILGLCLEMNPANFFKLQVDYGGVSKFRLQSGMTTVEYINR